MSDDNLVYDNHMNLVPDVKDTDQVTGMSYVDQSRPIQIMKSETVPNDFKDSLVDPRVFDVSGGEAISADTNPMMVNTIIESETGGVSGANNQYHRMEIQENSNEVQPVVEVLDPEDAASLESLVKLFHATLESAGYEVDFKGQTDPNEPVDLVTLLNEVEYADGLSLRSTQRIETITDLRNEVIGMGGITKDQAYAIEALRPNFLSSKVALETFTKFPTRTNYENTLVAMEDLVEAAAVAGITVTVLAIASLIKWIISTIQKLRYDTKSDSVRSRYIKGYSALLTEVKSSSNRFRDVLAKSPEFQNYLSDYCNKLKVNPSMDLHRTAIELDDSMYHFLTDGKYTQFVAGMYNGESTKLSAYLTTAVNNSMISIEAKFNKLRAIADNNALVPLDEFAGDWKEVADLANYLIGGIDGSPENTINKLHGAIAQLHREDDKAVSPMRFEAAMTSMRYSLDKNFRFDRGSARKLENMFGTIKRIEENMRKIQDPEVRKNRADLYTIFKKEVQLLATLISALKLCDNKAVAYIGLTNQVVSRNGRMWQEAFKVGNVNFQWNGI